MQVSRYGFCPLSGSLISSTNQPTSPRRRHMAINDQVKFTWVGHGTWKVRTARGKDMLIDPWVMSNPMAPDHLKAVERLDIMLITHGHGDHVADAVEIAKATHPKILAPFEVGTWLTKQGVEDVIAFGKGGTVEV